MADTREFGSLINQLSASSPAEQEKAIEMLARLGEQCVPALIELIPSKMVNQISALARIGYPGNRDAIPHLVEELQYAGSFPPKDEEISKTILAIGMPAFEAIRNTLRQHSSNAQCVHELAWILLGMEISRIEYLVPDLIHTLQVGLTGDTWYYRGIVDLVGRIGSPAAAAAIPALCRYFESFQHKSIYLGATDQGNHPGTPAAEADVDIRISAISALGKFSTSDLLSSCPTLDLASRDSIPEIRRLAVDILARVRSE